MEFDADKFIYIAAWVIAVSMTLLSGFSVWLMWYWHCTEAGKMEAAVDMLTTGRVPHFRWWPICTAILAWIAIFSFS